MKVALILKDTIRGRKRFLRDFETLQERVPGASFRLLVSEYAGHAVELACAECGEHDYMIAAGGDGTLHEVINGCMQARQREPELGLPVFGVLPFGSANDFVRSLGLQGSVEELAGLLSTGERRTLDLGRLQCQGSSGQDCLRYFINIADVGIGAAVVQRLESSGKRLGADLSYLWAIVATFLSYRHIPLRIVSDRGLDWQGRTLILGAGNGRYFGSRLCLAPTAELDDGEFAVTLVGDASIVDFALNLGRLKRGELLEHPAAHYHRAASLRIEAPEGRAPVEADGEFLGYTPARLDIVPGAVEFLTPPGDR